MVTISSNLIVSHAVESSVKTISEELSARFQPLYKFPVMYYDWEQGYSKQFEQYFAKVPTEYREHPWTTTVYTYGQSKPNPIQSRALLENYIPLYSSDGVSAGLNVYTRLMFIDVLCTVLTNDGNYANSIALNRTLSQSYWKNIEYSDVFYPQWKPNTEYPKNFTIIPVVPNGYTYIANNSGKSGIKPITFPTTIGETFIDGDITWVCADSRKAKLEINNFTYPSLKAPNVYTEGIRYSVEFAYSINFVGMEDSSYQLSTIKGFDNHLYEVLSKI